MKKYTYLTDHPRNPVSREKLIRAIIKDMEELDLQCIIKLYVHTHRMRRDKVK